VHVEAGVRDQPRHDRRALVGTVIVGEHVHVEVVRNLAVDLGQELLELHGLMATGAGS